MHLSVACAAPEIEKFGLGCTLDEACPVFLEVSSVEAAGERIFAAGNLHTATATVFSVLLSSDDGGATWTEPHERIPGATLELMQFIDLENGWVAGQMAGALPRDPFFLITTNAGKTWTQRPIFEDTRVGAVDQFWFETRTTGQMTVDRTQTGDSGGRYELYESMTGGESWMLRQVSMKPMLLKQARPPGTGTWRARADGPSKSFRIEKRGSASWTSVASFSVAAGECRPAETVLSEPAVEAAPAKPEPDATGVFRVPGSTDPKKKKKD
jgi:hypothetical protein